MSEVSRLGLVRLRGATSEVSRCELVRVGGALRAPRPRSLLRAARCALTSGATPRLMGLRQVRASESPHRCGTRESMRLDVAPYQPGFVSRTCPGRGAKPEV